MIFNFVAHLRKDLHFFPIFPKVMKDFEERKITRYAKKSAESVGKEPKDEKFLIIFCFIQLAMFLYSIGRTSQLVFPYVIRLWLILIGHL